MVGTVYPKETRTNSEKGQVQVLAKNSQVWDKGPKIHQRRERDRSRKGDTKWMDSIRLEMKNNRIAFQTFDGDTKKLIGYTEIKGHIVFDVKLAENSRRKARFCAYGHKVETRAFLTYSTVVSRDSVRIILMIAALNKLDLQGVVIQNAF